MKVVFWLQPARLFWKRSWRSIATCACWPLVASLPAADDHPGFGPADSLGLCRHHRRAGAFPPLARCESLFRPGAEALPIRRNRLCRQHLQVWGPSGADLVVRGRQRDADALPPRIGSQGMGAGTARRSTMRKARVALARRLAIIMHAMLRHGSTFQAA